MRKLAVFVALLLAAPAFAQAQTGAWTVSGNPPVMKAVEGPLTVTYSAVPDDDDAYKVVITGCNGADWSDDGAIHFDAEKRAERLYMVREALHDMIVAGADECAIGGDDHDAFADRTLEGLDAAYAQFSKLKK